MEETPPTRRLITYLEIVYLIVSNMLKRSFKNKNLLLVHCVFFFMFLKANTKLAPVYICATVQKKILLLTPFRLFQKIREKNFRFFSSKIIYNLKILFFVIEFYIYCSIYIVQFSCLFFLKCLFFVGNQNYRHVFEFIDIIVVLYCSKE